MVLILQCLERRNPAGELGHFGGEGRASTLRRLKLRNAARVFLHHFRYSPALRLKGLKFLIAQGEAVHSSLEGRVLRRLSHSARSFNAGESCGCLEREQVNFAHRDGRRRARNPGRQCAGVLRWSQRHGILLAPYIPPRGYGQLHSAIRPLRGKMLLHPECKQREQTLKHHNQ